MFGKFTGRKYAGLIVVTLSILLLLSQLGVPLVPFSALPAHSGVASIVSLGGIVAGVYFLAGPIPALVSCIPLIVSGCGGGGGGGGGGEGDEDLGEPPEPPSASIYNP